MITIRKPNGGGATSRSELQIVLVPRGRCC